MEYVPSFSLKRILEFSEEGGRGGRGRMGEKEEEEALAGCVQMLGDWEMKWQVLVDVVVGLSVLHG